MQFHLYRSSRLVPCKFACTAGRRDGTIRDDGHFGPRLYGFGAAHGGTDVGANRVEPRGRVRRRQPRPNRRHGRAFAHGRGACGSARARHGGTGGGGRHGVRDVGAVQPSRTNASVLRTVGAGTRETGRRRLRGPQPESGRQRHPLFAGAGHRSGGRRSARAGAASQRSVFQAYRHGHAVCHVEKRDDAGRKIGDPHRRQQVDQRRAIAGGRPCHAPPPRGDHGRRGNGAARQSPSDDAASVGRTASGAHYRGFPPAHPSRRERAAGRVGPGYPAHDGTSGGTGNRFDAPRRGSAALRDGTAGGFEACHETARRTGNRLDLAGGRRDLERRHAGSRSRRQTRAVYRAENRRRRNPRPVRVRK